MRRVNRYLEFLSMGGSKWISDELRHAGVDLASPAPRAALEKFVEKKSWPKKKNWRKICKVRIS